MFCFFNKFLVVAGFAMLLIGNAALGLTGDTNVHDPSLLRVGNTTYCLSTGPSIRIRKTNDPAMVGGWAYLGFVWATQPAWIAQRLGATPPDIWAPNINYWNGKYYLYYSASIIGNGYQATIGLMTATNIEGPWTDEGEVHYTSYPIDPNIVWEGTQPYVTFGSFDGIYIRAIDPATGKMSVSDTSQTLLAKGIEASSIVKDGSYYYLFGSRGLCCSGVNSTYQTVVGRATNIRGPYKDKDGVDMTQSGRTTVLSTSGNQIGPGGGEVFFVNGEKYFGYHYYDGANNGKAMLNIRKLRFSGGWPVLDDIDADIDGLLDSWEVAYFANLSRSGSEDTDGDGYGNEAEESAQSDPTVTSSIPGDINGDSLPDGRLLLYGDAMGTTSFNTGLNWSGGSAPAAGQNHMVAVQHLRTPTDAANYSFAGGKLVLFTGGNLIAKGSGVLSFPHLQLDGGRLHNGSNANVVVTIGGAISVSRASIIYAQNQGMVVSATMSGAGNLTLDGFFPVTFAGVNSWSGSLAVTGNTSFTLAGTGVLKFKPGANGINNAISGTRPVTLNGTFDIDTSSASTAPGSSWTLIGTSGTTTYGAGFAVSGFGSDGGVAGARKWTKEGFEFDEATGVLRVVSVPQTAQEAWRVTYFGSGDNAGDGADMADPDADGRSNLLEYAFGTVPTIANSGSPVVAEVSDGVLTLTFTHIGDPGLSYHVEASNDLVSWAIVHTYIGFTVPGSTTYIDGTPLAAGLRRFLRLMVTSP